jgi:hypothetical protein
MCSAFPQETKTMGVVVVSHSGGLAKIYIQSMMDKTNGCLVLCSLFLELSLLMYLKKGKRNKTTMSVL